MAVGFPTKDTFVNGDVYSAGDVNDLAGTVNTIPALIEANAGGQYAAGKNKIINGDFDINQRAFTSTTTTGTYGFDRWILGTSDGTCTYSAQTFTAGAAPVAGYEGKNFAQLVTTGQTLTTAFSNLQQRIESVRTFAGQTVTVSFWAKANTGTPNVVVNLGQFFGTGGSPSTTVATTGTVQSITTSWARYSFTIVVPSIAGKTLGTTAGTDFVNLQIVVSGGSATNVSTVGIQSNTFDIWGVQAEAGSTASPFQTATGTKQGELAACQRYFYRTPNPGWNNTGNCSSTTTALVPLIHKVSMRAAPSLTVVAVGTLSAGGANRTVASVGLDNASTDATNVIVTTTTAVLVAGWAAGHFNANLQLSAEL